MVMSQADSPNTMSSSRRTLLTSAVTAAALIGAAGANAVAIALTTEHDPILEAIDRYWAAVRLRTVTMMETWDGGGHPEFAHLPKRHPFWQEKDDVFYEAFDAEWEAHDALFETPPTTIAGVAALLEVLGTDPYHNPDSGFEKGESVLEWAQGRDRERVNQFMSTLATALRTAGVRS
jgi:hypothetical protein